MPYYKCKGCKREKHTLLREPPEDRLCTDCRPPSAEQIKEWYDDGTNEDDMFRCPWCTYTFEDEIHDMEGKTECPECEKPVAVDLDYTTHVRVKRIGGES